MLGMILQRNAKTKWQLLWSSCRGVFGQDRELQVVPGVCIPHLKVALNKSIKWLNIWINYTGKLNDHLIFFLPSPVLPCQVYAHQKNQQP